MGQDVADFSYRIPFGLRSMTQVLVGKMTPEIGSWIGKLIYFTRKTMLDNAYAEAALTEDGELIFYELFDLSKPIHPSQFAPPQH